jgi:hypothetical protein
MASSCLHAYQSGYANQRFLDNADQFSEEQGVRSENFQYSLLNEKGPFSPYSQPLNTPQYGGIEVVKEDDQRINNKKSRSITSKGGFSFSDMAKKTQKKKKGSSRYSFRGMAKSTKKGPVPTFNFRLKRRTQTTQDH